MKPRGVPWMQGSFGRDAGGAALAAMAFGLAPALVVVLAAPVAGQLPYTVVAESGSHEAVKKRALWTNCLGVSLSTLVISDTDLSEESVWNAAEAALRSARIYYEDPNPRRSSRWVVMVRVWGGTSAHYVAIEFLDTLGGSVIADWTIEQLASDDGVVPSDLDFLGGGSYTVMTYRVHALGSGRANPPTCWGRFGRRWIRSWSIISGRTPTVPRAHYDSHGAFGGHWERGYGHTVCRNVRARDSLGGVTRPSTASLGVVLLLAAVCGLGSGKSGNVVPGGDVGRWRTVRARCDCGPMGGVFLAVRPLAQRPSPDD